MVFPAQRHRCLQFLDADTCAALQSDVHRKRAREAEDEAARKRAAAFEAAAKAAEEAAAARDSAAAAAAADLEARLAVITAEITTAAQCVREGGLTVFVALDDSIHGRALYDARRPVFEAAAPERALLGVLGAGTLQAARIGDVILGTHNGRNADIVYFLDTAASDAPLRDIKGLAQRSGHWLWYCGPFD